MDADQAHDLYVHLKQTDASAKQKRVDTTNSSVSQSPHDVLEQPAETQTSCKLVCLLLQGLGFAAQEDTTASGSSRPTLSYGKGSLLGFSRAESPSERSEGNKQARRHEQDSHNRPSPRRTCSDSGKSKEHRHRGDSSRNSEQTGHKGRERQHSRHDRDRSPDGGERSGARHTFHREHRGQAHTPHSPSRTGHHRDCRNEQSRNGQRDRHRTKCSTGDQDSRRHRHSDNLDASQHHRSGSKQRSTASDADFANLIPGYNDLSAAQKLKARTKHQLQNTASKVRIAAQSSPENC